MLLNMETFALVTVQSRFQIECGIMIVKLMVVGLPVQCFM